MRCNARRPGQRGASLWIFLPLIAFVALAILLASGLGRDPELLPSALAGKPVPDFSLPSLVSERTLSNQDLTGRWQLLNVWATWCPTCHIEHPYLLELAARGVPIVGLNYKDEDPAARDYLAELGNPFTEVIVDKDGQLGLDLGVYGAPETFLINPQGEIVLRQVGDMNERVWQEKFAPVLEKAGQQNAETVP
ncbi:DsbE family thiol:disulfide interchange protein [Alloalcanivorax mobilis]|uniref:DsbE family thiol:disulfide interchange protein n=1 Tax=Alloalcanivorax mobilis TaxID=2019569 RepID=UPI000C7739B7|nr:DsbE family thiol:disulfide interchange protein [Alloalcanivorax mobilis]